MWVRDTVYADTAAPERNLDARRLGVAVLVDLDRVGGHGSRRADPHGTLLKEIHPKGANIPIL
jgi:hypothetical protein